MGALRAQEQQIQQQIVALQAAQAQQGAVGVVKTSLTQTKIKSSVCQYILLSGKTEVGTKLFKIYK